MFKKEIKHMSIHPSERLIVCISKSNRLAVWNLMTCSMVFHFKIKAQITQAKFLGDCYLSLLTENSVVIFDLEKAECVEELRLWEDERVARYDRTLRLNDMDVKQTAQGEWLVMVGGEAGTVIVWKLKETLQNKNKDVAEAEAQQNKATKAAPNQETEENQETQETPTEAGEETKTTPKVEAKQSQLESSFKIFKIYTSTRVKRNRLVQNGDDSYLSTISTEGHVSLFDITQQLQGEFTSDIKSNTPLAALAERQMDVRLTQMEATVLASSEEIKQNNARLGILLKPTAPGTFNSKDLKNKAQAGGKRPNNKRFGGKRGRRIGKQGGRGRGRGRGKGRGRGRGMGRGRSKPSFRQKKFKVKVKK